MTFSPDFLDELRSRVTLSEVVGRRVALKRRGREHTGLCPFHNEKTPSFTLNDQKGFFHCFGCGAHGDVVGFVMRAEGLPFPEAVEKLAREAGLALPVSSPAERQRAQQAASLQDATEKAAAWFERNLRSPEGAQALNYLRNRGLSDDTIRRFRLGYAPDRRDALRHALQSEAMPERLLVEAGLLILPDDGRGAYDRFRGRVMFPIEDRRGRIIAFGGRILGDGEPKYLNSPETPLFHKGEVLFAFARARLAVHEGAMPIVAEGYMDVIALHQAGFGGAVAPLGTALTESQLQLLWRMGDEPVLCFDGDSAGARAAMRAAERALPLLQPGKSLRFMALPAGEDPDTLIRKQGPAAFAALLQSAEPLAEILWRMETRDRPADTPERRASIEAALMRRAAAISDQTVQNYYRREWRDRLWRSFAPPRSARPAARGHRPFQGPAGPGGRTNRFQQPEPVNDPAAASARRTSVEAVAGERALLAALLRRPALIPHVAEELAHLTLQDGRLEVLRTALLEWAGNAGIDDAAESPGFAEESGVAAVEKTASLPHLDSPGATALAAELLAGTGGSLHGDERHAGFAQDMFVDEEAAAWRHAAAAHRTNIERASILAEAERELAENPTDENWRRLQALIEQISSNPATT